MKRRPIRVLNDKGRPYVIINRKRVYIEKNNKILLRKIKYEPYYIKNKRTPLVQKPMLRNSFQQRIGKITRQPNVSQKTRQLIADLEKKLSDASAALKRAETEQQKQQLEAKKKENEDSIAALKKAEEERNKAKSGKAPKAIMPGDSKIPKEIRKYIESQYGYTETTINDTETGKKVVVLVPQEYQEQLEDIQKKLNQSFLQFIEDAKEKNKILKSKDIDIAEKTKEAASLTKKIEDFAVLLEDRENELRKQKDALDSQGLEMSRLQRAFNDLERKKTELQDIVDTLAMTLESLNISKTKLEKERDLLKKDIEDEHRKYELEKEGRKEAEDKGNDRLKRIVMNSYGVQYKTIENMGYTDLASRLIEIKDDERFNPETKDYLDKMSRFYNRGRMPSGKEYNKERLLRIIKQVTNNTDPDKVTYNQALEYSNFFDLVLDTKPDQSIIPVEDRGIDDEESKESLNISHIDPVSKIIASQFKPSVRSSLNQSAILDFGEELLSEEKEKSETKGEGKGVTVGDLDSILNVLPGYQGIFTFNRIKDIEFKEPLISFVILLEDYYKKGVNHYVAMFIDFDEKECNYYNSFGDPAPDKLKKYFNVQFDKMQLPFMMKWKDNRIANQGASDLCALFCAWFLYQRYFGFSFKEATDWVNIKDNEKRLSNARIHFDFV